MLNVLFSALPYRWPEYDAPLRQAFAAAGLNINLATDIPPEDVDYIVYAPNGPVTDFTPFTRLKAVLGLWAGVENIVTNPTLRVPLTRMVDNGLSEGMVEWVTAHVLRYHIGMDAHIVNPQDNWLPEMPPLARDRTVGILGLGVLGQACGQALAQLNFNVLGWSRSEKSVDNIQCLNGASGLEEVLQRSDILVLLLPVTQATAVILDAGAIAKMKPGARIINAGRGELIEDAALLAALKTGQIDHATLDVFRTEPLPKTDPYWAHPRVTVTPHIASETRPSTAADIIADNIKRNEAGVDLRFLVDRSAGY